VSGDFTIPSKWGCDNLPFQRVSIFFKRSIPSGISITNRHMLILDGHGSHVTLEVIEQVQEFGLDMITLPLHTSHALQPLDVACFKPFKITFRDIIMVRRNYIELNKITLARWINKTLDLTHLQEKYRVRVQRYKDLAI